MKNAIAFSVARTIVAVCIAACALAACQPKPPNATGMPALAAPLQPAVRGPIVWTRDAGSPAEFQSARGGIARILRNPEGVQYRGLYALRSDNGHTLICGEINPRNLAGEQAGFFHFAYLSPGVFVPSNDPRFAALFPTICQPRTMTPGAPGIPSLPAASAPATSN